KNGPAVGGDEDVIRKVTINAAPAGESGERRHVDRAAGAVSAEAALPGPGASDARYRRQRYVRPAAGKELAAVDLGQAGGRVGAAAGGAETGGGTRVDGGQGRQRELGAVAGADAPIAERGGAIGGQAHAGPGGRQPPRGDGERTVQRRAPRSDRQRAAEEDGAHKRTIDKHAGERQRIGASGVDRMRQNIVAALNSD